MSKRGVKFNHGAKRGYTWKEYEEKYSLKRVDRNSANKKNNKTPLCITVQRMSCHPTGRQKKYEALDTRDFINLSNYDELSIENIRLACEAHYNAPAGSYDVLLTDKGPSRFLTEQIQNKKATVQEITIIMYTDDTNLHKAFRTSHVLKQEIISAFYRVCKWLRNNKLKS